MEDFRFILDLVGLAEVVWMIGGAVVGVIGSLMFGRRYKERIAALEERKPSTPVVIHNTVGDSSEDILRMLKEINKADYALREIRAAVSNLPQKPLRPGITYSKLPSGTNIVHMKDGTLRLAVPVRLAVSGSLGAPTAIVKVDKVARSGTVTDESGGRP